MSFKETIEKITSSRVFTVVLCLVLCASLLFSYATPRAQAIAIADDIAIGILALLILATAGVVIHVNNQNQMSAVGNSFKTSMYQWGTSAEKLDEVDEFFGGLTLYNPGGSDDGDEDPRREVRLARGILTGIATWIASVVVAGKIDSVESSAPDGFLYYNGHLLPNLTQGISYAKNGFMIVLFISEGVYHFVSHNQSNNNHMFYDSSQNSIWARRGPVVFELVDGTWVQDTSYSLNSDSIMWISFDSIVWSSFDLEKYVYGGTQTSEVVFSGSKSSATYTEYIPPLSFVGDLPNQIVSGEKDEDDIILPDIIDYGAIIQDGMTLEDSVIDIMGQLSSGAKDHDEFVRETTFAEYPVFTQNLPLLPSMSRVYSVGEKADTLTVQATANGTLLYEWLNTSTVPYTVLGTGPSFTPDTSREITYNLACRVTNTVPCSFIETGYVTNASYSTTYKIIVQADPVVDPDPDPGTDPNPDPGTDPNPDPGTDPNPDPGTDPNPDPGTDPDPDPGTDPGLDPSLDSSVDAGQQYVDELTGMIPNDSQGFVDAMGSLADSLGYTGTECVLPIPALKLPALAGLFPSYTVMQAQEVDFEEMIGMLPPNLLLLVRSLLTIALIAYCFKELYSTFSYFFVLKGGKV